MNSSNDLQTQTQVPSHVQIETEQLSLTTIRDKLLDKLKAYNTFEQKVLSDLNTFKKSLRSFTDEIRDLIDTLNEKTISETDTIANTSNNRYADTTDDIADSTTDEEDEISDNNSDDNSDDNGDDDHNSEPRFFKAITIDKDNKTKYIGDFVGRSALQAASKALTVLIREQRSLDDTTSVITNENTEKIQFNIGIRETSRSSDAQENNTKVYQCTREPLQEPTKIKVGNSEIVYNAANHVKRIYDDNKEICPDYDILKQIDR